MSIDAAKAAADAAARHLQAVQESRNAREQSKLFDQGLVTNSLGVAGIKASATQGADLLDSLNQQVETNLAPHEQVHVNQQAMSESPLPVLSPQVKF